MTRRIAPSVRTPAHIDTHPLFEDTDHRAPGRRWGWMAGVAAVMVLVIGGAYGASTGAFARLMAAADRQPAAVEAAPIELLSLRGAPDDTGTFVVTGLVQNPEASASIRGVFAAVLTFDAEGQFIASSRAAIDSSVLSPGGQSPFSVKLPSSSQISRYRVSFQHEDGAAVRHVDRRGTMPEGTTGEAIEKTTTGPDVTQITARNRD